MVDKNSSIKPIFRSILDTAVETVERATEIPFEAVSDIVVEPITGLLTPGTNEEERKKIKDDIFKKDEIRKKMLEGIQINELGGPSRVDEILKLPSNSREQLLAIRELEKDLVDMGYPEVKGMDIINYYRELIFGPEYDIHKQVAEGSVRISEMNNQQLGDYFFGYLTAADAGALAYISAPLRGIIKKALDEKNFIALKNIVAKFFPDKTAQNVSKNLKGTQDPETLAKAQKGKEDKIQQKIADLEKNLKLKNPIAFTNMYKTLGVSSNSLQTYIKNNPDSYIAKMTLSPQVERAEQVTEEVLEILRNAVESKGGKLNKLEAVRILKENNNPIARTTLTRILKDSPDSEIAQLVGARETGDTGLFTSYFPGFTRDSTIEARAQHTIIRDIYRAGGFGNEKEFVEFMNEYGFVPNKIQRLDAEGKAVLNEKGKPIYDPNPDYNKTDMKKKRENLFAYIKDEFFKEPGSYEEYLSKIAHAKNLTDYAINKFVDTVKNNEGFRNQFVSEYKTKYPTNTASINNDVEGMAFDYATTHFNAQMSHIMPIARTKGTTPVREESFKLAKNLEGQMFQSEFMNVNFAAHNIGTQEKYENIIRRIVSDIKNGRNIEKNLNKLEDVNKAMTERGLETYLRFSDKQMPDNVFKILEARVGNKVEVEPNQPGVKSLFIGEKSFSLEDNIAFFNMRMDGYVKDPSSFKISNARPKAIDADSDRMFIEGSAPYIGEGKPTNFEQGGDVETEEKNQSFLSKAASTIGGILMPKAEAFPLPKNFLLGDLPKIFKKTETVKQITGPVKTEKRYNILDEAGNKVFQSKSLPDAERKALQLGEAEGRPFVVQEIEVPIKQKKSKTTKPGTDLARTITPETVIGSGNNKLYYSDLNSIVNTETGNLTIKGVTVPADSVSMSAKGWHDWFRSNGIKEGELYDSYIRSYLNKKGKFDRDAGKFMDDEKISFAEIKELVDTSPTNFLQTVSYGDAAGNLKYGDSGRQPGYIEGSRTERVLWLDSVDIRGDIGVLPTEVARYEGHGNMRNVTSSPDFAAQGNKLDGEPYVVGWSLGSDRVGSLDGRSIKVTVADEIQSDFLQKAAQKKSEIKAQIRRYVTEMTDAEQMAGLDELYKRLENVFRPMPATLAQIKQSIEQLQRSADIFKGIASMNLDDVTKLNLEQLGEAATLRDEALAKINATIDSIDSRELFPNIPFKDQKDWVDAIIKNDIYNAAKKRFILDQNGNITINNDAPAYYAVAPAKVVKAYRGGMGVELPPNDPSRRGQMVAYDMQYGGPNLNDYTGQHFTSNTEETLNKIANMKNSKVEVGKVVFGANGESADTFIIELTPEMLLPYKAYKKDGGLIKKSILYTPIVSIDKLLSPIGANRW